MKKSAALFQNEMCKLWRSNIVFLFMSVLIIGCFTIVGVMKMVQTPDMASQDFNQPTNEIFNEKLKSLADKKLQDQIENLAVIEEQMAAAPDRLWHPLSYHCAP